MSTPLKHIIHQGPTLATLGDVLVQGVRQQLGFGPEGELELPSEEVVATIAPRPPALVRDFLRHVGGDPGAWRGELPPHLFPQWIFPVAEKTLRGVAYPLFKMVNGGCRLEVRGRLPIDEPLRVAARLEEIDDNGRRAILHQRVATGTEVDPELVVAHVYEVVPLGGGSKESKKKKERPRVPRGARELAYWRLPRDAGLSFAALTGDFNPVHWLPPYARAFGFRAPILHGFATMTRTFEGLGRGLLSGDVRRLTALDARFTKPLVLPARVGLYVEGEGAFVGEAPGGPAYLTATYTIDGPDRGEE